MGVVTRICLPNRGVEVIPIDICNAGALQRCFFEALESSHHDISHGFVSLWLGRKSRKSGV